MERAVVGLLTKDPRLTAALATFISTMLPEIATDRGMVGPAPDVVVTTQADCSWERCHQLVKAGARVIVLSPSALPSERLKYERAGAFALLPMSIERAGLLVEAIRMAAAGQRMTVAS